MKVWRFHANTLEVLCHLTINNLIVQALYTQPVTIEKWQKGLSENLVLSQWSRLNLSNKSTVKVNFCQVKTLTVVADQPTVCMHVTPSCWFL